MNTNSLYNNKWIKEAYMPTTVAYYYRTWNGYQMDKQHEHNHIEIMYVLNSHCDVVISQKVIKMKKGDFILIDSGVSHKLVIEKGVACRMLNIEFKLEKVDNSKITFRDIVETDGNVQLMLNGKKRYLLMKDNDGLYNILKRLIIECDHPQTENQLFIHTLYLQLIVNIARTWAYYVKDEKDAVSEYIMVAKDYIRHHYDEAFSIRDIAEKIGIHENYLQRIFKSYTDMTITEFAIKVRMEKVCMLLSNTELSILDICEAVGINSRQYLSKLFKERYNKTPIQYRKESNL